VVKSESIVICVCGMAGSGKSTVARKLAKKYKLKYYSGGDALKVMAIEEGYEDIDQGWWESKEGLCFLEEREKDPDFDRTVDSKLLEVAKKGNVVLDSWTMPWLLKEGFKIRLEASFEKRVERIAKRDSISREEAVKALRRKEEKTESIYRSLYGFDLEKDFSPFNLILDTDSLTAEEVFQTLSMILDNLVISRVKSG